MGLKQMALTRRRTIALMTGGAGALTALPARADTKAETYVSSVLAEANAVFDADEATRLAAIEKLVTKYVDMRRVSRFVLGQYARRMTPSQKETYAPLFRKFATLVYQNALSNYSGEKLAVKNSVDRSERDIIVNSEVVDAPPGSQFANLLVHWRVYRTREGEQSIIDAGAEGIWLAIEQRGQFTSIIANNGGGEAGIDVLLAQLQKQVG